MTTLLLLWNISQYSPGVMENVRTYRGIDIGRADGMVAVLDCDRIGDTLWLRPLGQADWESFVVMDCAHPLDGTPEWMARNRVIAEVDHQTAARWDAVGEMVYAQIKGPVPQKGINR